MAYYIPLRTVTSASDGRLDRGVSGVRASWRERYKARVRSLRVARSQDIVQRVEERLLAHEAEVRTILERSLEAIVYEAALTLVEQVLSSVPEIVAQGVAERAAFFVETVLRGERGVTACAHPRDYEVITRHLGGVVSIQWREDDTCPRGEIRLHVSGGVIAVRWRDMVRGMVREVGDNER